MRGDQRLFAVVLGENSPKRRDREMAKLRDRVFGDVGARRGADSGQPPACFVIRRLRNAMWSSRALSAGI